MENQNINPFQSMQKNPLENINPLEYPEVKCPECGGTLFIPAMKFFEIPGAIAGLAGETIPAPMKVFVCSNCKTLCPLDQKVYDELKEKAKNKQNASSIIV